MNKLPKVLIIALLLVTLMLINSSSVKRVSAGSVLYVHIYGNDSSDCLTPLTSCATINGALAKAAAGDTIMVSSGTFIGTEDEVVLVNKNIFLSGGWDDTYTTRSGFTILDGQYTRQGMNIAEAITASVEYFVIQHSAAAGNGGAIDNYGILTLDHCNIQDNQGTGIINPYSTLSMFNSTVRNNGTGGIYNYQGSGPLTIVNSTISNNAGTGIYLNPRQNAFIVNSTISGNEGDDGGGIYNWSGEGYKLILINDTITGNEATYFGGGIYSGGYGQILMSNTIVSGNFAQYAFDCYGNITSQGYNLIGDSLNCSFSSTTGDQLDIDPLLGLLQDNGGPTYTHWLFEGSPAIDGGNPTGCLDQDGNLQWTDQRGSIRPLDGDSDGNNICDIGTYEADPNNLPSDPATHWYVTSSGNDANDCHYPDTACATINGAIGKASSGDTIYISSAVYYSMGGSEVVRIDKDLTLSGGWDAGFYNQNGYSVIDAGYAGRGIVINQEVVSKIEWMIVQNGWTVDGPGGGIFLDYRARLTLDHSIVYGNLAGDENAFPPISQSGGGIGMTAFGRLTVNNSLIYGNRTIHGSGGGIYIGSDILTLNNSLVGYNSSGNGGGIGAGQGGQIVLNDSRVIYNTGTGSAGGGIYQDTGQIVLHRSSIIGNTTDGSGGGIHGQNIEINDSLIANNTAYGAGGIYIGYMGTIRGSGIISNIAIGNGGGLWTMGDLFISNSTIAYNKAKTLYLNDAMGGGIYRSGGEIQASNVTIARNSADGSGGGIGNQSAPIYMRNSLIAENKAPVGPDCVGMLLSDGYIFLGNLADCGYTPGEGDLWSIDARISLQYGWPRALALYADSPAIDAGNPAGCKDEAGNLITIDQIGTDRPLDGDGDSNIVCDMGAFEYDPAHPPHWTFLSLVTK